MLVMADRSFSLLGEGDEKHKKTVLTAKSKYGFLVRKTFGDAYFFFFFFLPVKSSFLSCSRSVTGINC